ncbi:uncharacterized protein ermn [Sphaeramia orbicularis]|uniref:uncharacterized protein ermn n=1 Tax=Sphaeramia orbicularis TaxID=375764 RepID=UPI00117D8D21|nr:uncharacterized protein LOC115411962 [Sphaeramia orbicularis]
MEKMEKSTTPNVPNLNEDALACQVLEIIGGITLRALQNLEGPEERDVWSMEEGDDSVFYSDDDAAHQDIRDNKPCEFNEHRRLVNSEADETLAPQREDDLGGGDEITEDDADTEVEKETTHQDIVNNQEEEHKAPQIDVTEPVDHLETANPHANIEGTVETCDLNNTPVDMKPEHNKPTEKAEVKESVEAQTANPERFDVTNEEKFTEDATTPKQMSSAELHISDDKQLEVDWQPEQGCSSHAPRGLNHDSGPGCSTLPPRKKASHQTSFNHLDSSKYSTVSYRKIRRGNTRQKIEVFEYMTMNL